MANQLDELKGKLSQLANQRKEVKSLFAVCFLIFVLFAVCFLIFVVGLIICGQIEDELKRVKDDLKGVDDHSNLVCSFLLLLLLS